MSLKQICFVSVFFSDDEDEPADPNIILEEPDDEASKSDKDVSDATGLQLYFLGVRRDNKDMLFSISPKRIPPQLPRSAYRGIDAGGPRARASWVGV
jgi:hypothetical protein